MDWPDDADGDVMRSLQSGGFNFDRETEIDFNIEFRVPPDESVLRIVKQKFPEAKVSFAEHDEILVQIRSLISYQFVTKMQDDLTEACTQFGGKCESWGVLWNPKR